jgi:hypothetical protein
MAQLNMASPDRTGAGRGSAARAQARFARNVRQLRRSLARPAAAAAPCVPSVPSGYASRGMLPPTLRSVPYGYAAPSGSASLREG